MSTIELYAKGAKVWVPDPTDIWRCGEVVEHVKDKHLLIQVDNGETLKVGIEKPELLPPLKNPEILIGENDLTSLSYLHEPAVLNNLKVRFCNHNAIYTYCGIVLVAINPYEDLPIYNTDTIMAYRGQAMGDLDPHIFAVAEEAYTQMERDNQNQSIIVSGESGAGKTMSAKHAMRYFATVGGSSTQTHVEKKVLASNPIMEAIGNAKTTRNDNSSRFGKYIELDFNSKYNIVGANMRTYLLEKSRVVFQAADERNYHVFYQLCAAAKEKSMGLEELQLGDSQSFHYTNQGDSPVIPSVSDAQSFKETKGAFTMLGFEDSQQATILRILAAILHLGNVQFLPGEEDTDSSFVSKSDPHLVILSDLLGVEATSMSKWLCNRKLQSMKEVITKPMPVDQASFARDALSKHIYAKLFDWIVGQINKSLVSDDKIQRFIGVLDIYGFETFEINSFEQFCINYANEKLQQQFNQHVFKLEQEEYFREQIEWKLIEYYDNQPCIDLIESKLGILDLLDEECRMPKGSDKTWCQKLFEQCKKWEHFEKPRLSQSSFLIRHFADRVTYDSSGFLEKNRDTVMEEHINILKASQVALVAVLFEEPDATKSSKGLKTVSVKPAVQGPGKSQRQNKKTVGSQFRESLGLLMATLNATTPHYVRCVKPNDEKEAFKFDPKRAVQQLRACGVLETVRISAAGFPSRWTYMDFLNRYRVLSKRKDFNRSDLKLSCEKILENVIKDEDKFQFGKTKIFFRAGQVAYLEKLRAEKLRACALIVIKHIRGWVVRKKFLVLKKGTLKFQCRARGFLARKKAQFLRSTKAAITIQKYIRGWVQCKKFKRTQRTALKIQTLARGMWARQKYQEMRCKHAAIVIQKNVRCFLAQRRYQKNLRRVVICQSSVRRFLARKKLKKLKVEAKSVEHVKKLNKGLENKIISLQHKIQELAKDNKIMKSKEAEFKQLTEKVDQAKHLEASVKQSNNKVQTLEEELASLRTQLNHLQDEKKDWTTEKETLKQERDQAINTLNAENSKLKVDLDHLNEQIKMREKGNEEILKAKIENEKKMLLDEFESERKAYQKLMREHARIEQRCENMQNELSRAKGGGLSLPYASHKRTASDISLLSIQTDATEVIHDDVSDTMDSEDIGYGSVRMKEKDGVHLKLDDITWDKSASKEGSPGDEFYQGMIEKDLGTIDGELITRLNAKLKEVSGENDRLKFRIKSLESKELDTPKEEKLAQDSIRLHELTMENAKIKEDLKRLRGVALSTDSSNNMKEVMEQFHAMQDELERRRDECIQMRSVLANQRLDIKNVVEEAYANKGDLNEDGELLMAFESQKRLIRHLESELESEKLSKTADAKELRAEISRLQEDNERQQKLLSQNLKRSPQAQQEAILQQEINRLTDENNDLREKNDSLSEQVKKLKKLLKMYANKLKDTGGNVAKKPSVLLFGSDGLEAPTLDLSGSNNPDTSHVIMPAIKHKEAQYLGMFEYRKEDEPIIIRGLIHDLKPKIAVTLLPGLPAYILFMCIRHTDHINDDEKVRSLLNSGMQAIKRVIKKRHDDIEFTVLWLANTCRLLHNLKQYSGDAAFQTENTPKQNEQCLRNFDLSEYRQVLSDVAVWIYQAVIKIMEENVQPLIVPAVLEHEAIPGISGNKPLMRGRSSSVAREIESPVDPQKAMEALLRELAGFYNMLTLHGVDPELVTQVFKQLFYFICAGALNNLLLRKDMCHWSKGMQIRYNLSHLEQWCRDQKIVQLEVTKTLEPIIQASQLLQARKTDDDVQSVCAMCDKLTTSQIIKILNLYTPADEFEERVPVSFTRLVQACLQQRDEKMLESDPLYGSRGSSTLLMDTKHAFPIRFPFNPSSICLENVNLPEVLNMSHILKKV